MRAPAHVLRARAQQKARIGEDARLRRHREFIRSLPCLVCGKPSPSEAAQLRVSSDAASERYILPLCGPATLWEDCCHNRLYYQGASHFWSALGLDPFELARRLWVVSGNRQAGEGFVRRARRRVEPHSGEGGEATALRAPARLLPEVQS